jgi:uracil-DNA glycosylase family 4
MSDDVRKETAELARGVRRVLERERAAGSGDLLARGAARAPAKRAKAAAPAAVSPPPAPPAPAEPERDLFGQPVVPPRPAAAHPPPEPALEEPEPERPLPPIEPEARAAIAAAAAPVLERIAAEVRACRACGLCETRNQAVPGVGSALSGIVFVGEAPGADEDRLGEPFVGRAGQLLDRIVKAVDDAHLIPGVPLDRRTLFIGNVIHCRPPENRVPLQHEVEASSPFLHRQLEALQPRIVCCLGKTAAEHLLRAKATLASMRGRIYPFHGAKLIVTYHTAAVLRNPELKRPVWEDMQLLAREYQTD